MSSTSIRFCAQTSVDYVHLIQRGSLQQLGHLLRESAGPPRHAVVISDDTVADLYAAQASSSLVAAGWPEPTVLTFAAGERSKSLDTHAALITRMLDAGVHRQSLLIALGGGVTCDLAGYVAATYMRGIDYVNVPTSLIAQLDAAIGGKVAVNHPQSKNFIGSFWHPRLVVIDPDLLLTLPTAEVSNGLAEAVKVAMIHSPELFELIESHGAFLLHPRTARDVLTRVITESVRAKVELLLPDPFESDLKRVLNLGHTFAHPLEVAEGFGLRHGFAVSIGMSIAARVALNRGLLDTSTADRLFRLLTQLGLPTDPPPIDPLEIWHHAKVVRRIRANNMFFVLPTAIGRVSIVNDLTEQEFVHAYRSPRAAAHSPMALAQRSSGYALRPEAT